MPSKTRSDILLRQNNVLDSYLSYNSVRISRSQMRLSLLAPDKFLNKSVRSRVTFPSSSYSEARPWPSVSEHYHFLSETELSLFTHYLTHTCRTIPFDADELYVLQVEIPNLAFRSNPLMASLLALAAASTVFDLIYNASADL